MQPALRRSIEIVPQAHDRVTSHSLLIAENCRDAVDRPIQKERRKFFSARTDTVIEGAKLGH